ncbi:MAG: Ig-like domain-containing protein [Deltaproteobacteria bacterium]|nr:Ig-like domain-containing protein [Deltaproteobacteria bacterium]MCB9488432.1 Ig-like domain-containing protein [Deltaproteobacteria bacterium]
MQRTLWAALTLSMLLVFGQTACTERETELPSHETEEAFTVIGTIPLDETAGVSTYTKISFRFSDRVDTATLDDTLGQLSYENADGELIPISFDLSTNGEGAILMTPNFPLPAGRVVHASITDQVRNNEGDTPEFEDGRFNLTFTTAPDRPQGGVPPSITGVFPTEEMDVFDWTTFRVYFSEPLDSSRVEYGVQVGIREAGDAGVVPAHMFVRDAQVVIDPDADLDPGKTYELFVSGDIRDLNGSPMGEEEAVFSYEIKDSNPRSTLELDMCPTLGSSSFCEATQDESSQPTSSFNDLQVNTMRLESSLLGTTTIKLSGQLVAQMGDTKYDSTLIPFVIRKGQVIKGESIESKLGGVIPTGLTTGRIDLQTIADTTGYLVTSGRAFGQSGGDATMLIWLDAGLVATNGDANQKLSQQVLGAQLVGRATVKPGGVFYMEAAGYTESTIFSEDSIAGVSLVFQNIPDEIDFEPRVDNDGPLLISTTPMAGESNVRLARDVIMSFSEAVSSATVGAITLQNPSGNVVLGKYFVNGPKVIFRPDRPLSPRTRYTIAVDRTIEDVLGNTPSFDQSTEFITGPAELTSEPPNIGTTDPGRGTDERFPAQLPIQFLFTQPMDPSSFVLGGNFVVQQDGVDVPGSLFVYGTQAIFWPNEPLTPGATYNVALFSNVRNANGVELDSDLDREPGGPIYTINFVAGQVDEAVSVVFELAPQADADNSGILDGFEQETDWNRYTLNVLGLTEARNYTGGYFISHLLPVEYEGNDPVSPGILVDGIRLYATNSGISIGAGAIAEIKAAVAKAAEEAGIDEKIVDVDEAFGILDTGRIEIVASDSGFADTREGEDGSPYVTLGLDVLFFPENADSLLQLVPAVNFQVEGPFFFQEDGRITLELVGRATIFVGIDFEALASIPLIGPIIESLSDLLGSLFPIGLPLDVELRAVSLYTETPY